MKRPIYILAGFSGMMIAALLLAWQLFERMLSPSTSAAAPRNIALHSTLTMATALFVVSAWFLWKVIRPRR